MFRNVYTTNHMFYFVILCCCIFDGIAETVLDIFYFSQKNKSEIK